MDTQLTTTEKDEMKPKQTLIEKIREEYQQALWSIDDEVKDLIQQGQDAKALVLAGSNLVKIAEIRETLSTFYTLFIRNESTLKKFGSERLRQLGHELFPIYAVMKDADASEEDIENYILKNLRPIVIYKKHWYIKEIVTVEIEYLLDTLQILIEPEFIPLLETTPEDGRINEKSDRYISPDVKIAVWRRDQGKCVECGSKEKLEYDHIIPVAKGGSNTARNIQLLCEKHNREKAAKIM